MEINELEKKYLEANSSFMLERTLINSMSDKDILSFITPLKNTYNKLRGTVETEYKKLLKRHKDLSEISKYFLYKVLELEIWGKELDELDETLNRINSLLFPKVTKASTAYSEKLDIKDIPIDSIIGQYVKLPWNLSKNICCPLHSDNTPSFKIYKKTNSWFCFWCNKGWNILNFISEMEWITTKEAYKKLISLI